MMKLVTSQEERIKQMQMVLPIMMTVPRDMSIENYFPINSETLHPPVCRNRVNITFLETFLLCFPKYSSQHRSWWIGTMPLFLAHHQDPSKFCSDIASHLESLDLNRTVSHHHSSSTWLTTHYTSNILQLWGSLKKCKIFHHFYDFRPILNWY